MKVAVVGGGIHGSSTAWNLVKRGHDVTLFEQFPLGHDRGSSHGDSRIVRRAYPDPFYTEIMGEGYGLWHELEAESGRKILYECGLLYFGPADSSNIQEVERALQSLGVEHEVLDSTGSQRVFPNLHLEPGEVGIYTPEAGWAHASLALKTYQELAVAKGLTVLLKRVVDLQTVTENFDHVVLCQGAWATQFLPLPVLVTLQTFGYIAGEHDGPVWIEEGEHSLYGFPSEPWHSGIKAGVHYKDVPFKPDEPDRMAVEGAIKLLKDFATRRFHLYEPSVERARGCLYTNTANEDFLMGNLGENATFVSACSGHGFKFAPWIGKTMADIVEGKKRVQDFPRFLWCAT